MKRSIKKEIAAGILGATIVGNAGKLNNSEHVPENKGRAHEGAVVQMPAPTPRRIHKIPDHSKHETAPQAEVSAKSEVSQRMLSRVTALFGQEGYRVELEQPLDVQVVNGQIIFDDGRLTRNFSYDPVQDYFQLEEESVPESEAAPTVEQKGEEEQYRFLEKPILFNDKPVTIDPEVWDRHMSAQYMPDEIRRLWDYVADNAGSQAKAHDTFDSEVPVVQYRKGGSYINFAEINPNSNQILPILLVFLEDEDGGVFYEYEYNFLAPKIKTRRLGVPGMESYGYESTEYYRELENMENAIKAILNK